MWICVPCTAAYSVGASSCPQCGSSEYVEEGMAKTTVNSGPSHDGETRAVEVTSVEVLDEPATGDDTQVEDVPVAPGEPYDTWLLVDLQNELADRGLSKTGNKPELVQRLIDDDNQSGGPEETTADVDDEVQPVF